MESIPVYYIFAALIFSYFLLNRILKFRSFGKVNLPLPPGSMGWPYVGETLQLYSQNPNTFFASKIKKLVRVSHLLFFQDFRIIFDLVLTERLSFCFDFGRYGSIFKTHILGCNCVMISSPEAARLVLVSKSNLFKPTFPASKERMLGKQALFFHQGDYHAKLRKLVLRAFMPEAIKNIITDIESVAKSTLESWDGRSITTYQEMKTVSFIISQASRTGENIAL